MFPAHKQCCLFRCDKCRGRAYYSLLGDFFVGAFVWVRLPPTYADPDGKRMEVVEESARKRGKEEVDESNCLYQITALYTDQGQALRHVAVCRWLQIDDKTRCFVGVAEYHFDLATHNLKLDLLVELDSGGPDADTWLLLPVGSLCNNKRTRTIRVDRNTRVDAPSLGTLAHAALEHSALARTTFACTSNRDAARTGRLLQGQCAHKKEGNECITCARWRAVWKQLVDMWDDAVGGRRQQQQQQQTGNGKAEAKEEEEEEEEVFVNGELATSILSEWTARGWDGLWRELADLQHVALRPFKPFVIKRAADEGGEEGVKKKHKHVPWRIQVADLVPKRARPYGRALVDGDVELAGTLSAHDFLPTNVIVPLPDEDEVRSLLTQGVCRAIVAPSLDAHLLCNEAHTGSENNVHYYLTYVDASQQEPPAEGGLMPVVASVHLLFVADAPLDEGFLAIALPTSLAGEQTAHHICEVMTKYGRNLALEKRIAQSQTSEVFVFRVQKQELSHD
jgi:hypothetical protein